MLIFSDIGLVGGGQRLICIGGELIRCRYRANISVTRKVYDQITEQLRGKREIAERGFVSAYVTGLFSLQITDFAFSGVKIIGFFCFG